MEKIAAKLGAVLYVCWGLLHFTAAYGVFKLAQNSPPAMAQGRLMQTAFYLAAFATAAIILSITLNWRNDRFGFWANAVMVGSRASRSARANRRDASTCAAAVRTSSAIWFLRSCSCCLIWRSARSASARCA